mgnify:CR=1 FL=1
MKQHPRESIVAQAGAELSKAVSEIATKHDLTYGELFSALSTIQGNWAKYQIRDERHPNDPGKPGGLA